MKYGCLNKNMKIDKRRCGCWDKKRRISLNESSFNELQKLFKVEEVYMIQVLWLAGSGLLTLVDLDDIWPG